MSFGPDKQDGHYRLKVKFGNAYMVKHVDPNQLGLERVRLMQEIQDAADYFVDAVLLEDD